jgi:predicted amidohydrolase
MAALLMEKLEEAVKKYKAKLVVVSDIAGFFLDKDILEDEARSLFSQATAYLSRFVKEKQLVLIATYPPHQNKSRNLFLHALSCGKANTVISLTQTKYDRDFVLEKHPRYVLGSAAFPSENLTLTDFTEGLNSGKNG